MYVGLEPRASATYFSDDHASLLAHWERQRLQGDDVWSCVAHTLNASYMLTIPRSRMVGEKAHDTFADAAYLLPMNTPRPKSGLDEKSIRILLGGARSKRNLLTFNGMNLADLRAEGADELDLSG